MGNIVHFKPKPKIKPKSNNSVLDFMELLGLLKELYIEGGIDDIFILVNGCGDKTCAGNGVSVEDAKDMCRDFIRNSKDYMD